MPCIWGILQSIPGKSSNNIKPRWRVELFDVKDGLWKWRDIFYARAVAREDASQKRAQGHRTRITKYFDWQQAEAIK